MSGNRQRTPVGLVTVTTLTTGLAAFGTLVIYARVAGSSDYVGFAVLWAAYYALAGCLAGLQQEVTRTSASRSDPRPLRLRALGLPLAVGVALGVVACATSPWWARHLATGPLLLGCVLLASVGLAGLVTVHGFLVARRRWGWACCLLLLDAGLRLVAVTAVATAGGNEVAQLIAVLSGSLVWLPCLPWLVRLPGFGWESAGAFVSRSASAMAATGLASLLIAGYPALVAATSEAETGVASAGLVAALVLFRSPIILIVNGFRPYVLVNLLTSGRSTRSAVFSLWLAVAALGGVAAAVAAAAGDAVLRVSAGSGFDITASEAAALVVSATLIAMLSLSSIAFVAMDRHLVATLGWALAVLVSLVVLVLPVDPDRVVVVSALVGPVLPLAIHAAILRFDRAAVIKEDLAVDRPGVL